LHDENSVAKLEIKPYLLYMSLISERNNDEPCINQARSNSNSENSSFVVTLFASLSAILHASDFSIFSGFHHLRNKQLNASLSFGSWDEQSKPFMKLCMQLHPLGRKRHPPQHFTLESK